MEKERFLRPVEIVHRSIAKQRDDIGPVDTFIELRRIPSREGEKGRKEIVSDYWLAAGRALLNSRPRGEEGNTDSAFEQMVLGSG